jgi:hypothetical protein
LNKNPNYCHKRFVKYFTVKSGRSAYIYMVAVDKKRTLLEALFILIPKKEQKMAVAEQALVFTESVYMPELPLVVPRLERSNQASDDGIARRLGALRTWHSERDYLERLYELNQEGRVGLAEYADTQKVAAESTPLLDAILSKHAIAYFPPHRGTLPEAAVQAITEQKFAAQQPPATLPPSRRSQPLAQQPLALAMAESERNTEYTPAFGIPAKEESPVTSSFYKNVKDTVDPQRSDPAMTQVPTRKEQQAQKKATITNGEALPRTDRWFTRITAAIGSISVRRRTFSVGRLVMGRLL